MLQAWLSIGYIVLLAFSCLPVSYGAGASPFWPFLHSWWGYRSGLDGNTHVLRGRPPSSQGTEVRRSDPDAHGNTTDIEYIYMRTRSDRGFELVNEDSLVVAEAQQRARVQRRQDRAVSQHGNDPHVESVALHAFQLVPQCDRHWPIRLLAVVVVANHYLLRPLRGPLARLFLRHVQAAPIECAEGLRSWTLRSSLCSMSGSALGGRYRQNRHHLHRISWEDREVRMVLEELGGSTMRIRPNDCVGAHQVGYILNAVLAHLLGLTEGTPHPDNCGIMLFGPGFPSRDSLLHLRPRTSSEREFQAAIRGLVLLPRKIARKVSFVLMLSPFLRAEVYGSVQSVHDNLSLCHRRLIKLNPHLVQSHTAG